MRIHTKLVYQFNPETENFDLIEDEHYEYDGPVALAGGSKSPSTTTTVQQSDPWSGIQPYLRGMYSQAAQEAYRRPGYFPSHTVAPLSPETQTSFELMKRQAGQIPSQMMGDVATQTKRMVEGVTPEAQYLTTAAQGGFLNNPYLERLSAATLDPIEENIKSQFAKAGRYGSAAMGEGLGRGLGAAQSQLMASLYGQERGLQQQAAQLAADQRLRAIQQGAVLGGMPAQLYSQMGGIAQQQQQAEIDAERARWDYYQNLPWQQLQRSASILTPGAGIGGTTTGSQTTPGGSRTAGALGGAASGAGMGFMFGGPMGALIGAGAGGLLGAF